MSGLPRSRDGTFRTPAAVHRRPEGRPTVDTYAFDSEVPALQLKLGGLLRGARKLVGLSGEKLAKELGISQSKLSRIELGQSAPSVELANRWAEIVRADDERATEVVGLAERIATDAYPRPWHGRVRGGIARLQHEIADSEATARLNLEWHPRLIPGLLQTPDYAREIFRCAYADGPELQAAVAARMARQAVLYDSTQSIRFLIGEAALRWPAQSTAALASQLDRLALFAADGSVDFAVVPFSSPFGAFSYHGWRVLAERGEEPDVVEIELETAKVDITDPEQTAAYRAAFERLTEVSLRGEAAEGLIRRIRAEL